ncbi:MAG: hypothetical protein K9M54_00190 [Kiritimatiellales bacterium]|nr:hypothetical protein [Kiritimatiellales bacterium]
MDSNIPRTLKRMVPFLPSLLLAGLVVLMASCHFIVPPQGWSKKWGPMVPHKTFPGDCSLCHVPESWSVLKKDFSYDHEKETGYPLEGAHADAACLRCHNDRGPVEAYVARGCSGCHVDPHAGSLGLSCDQCHSQMNWRPQGLVAEHAGTRFPLIGIHAVTACESCHPRAPVNFYMGAPTQCYSCHQKDYNSAPNHTGFSTECQQCHSQAGWDQANFNHSFFPLSGEHSGVACVACHTTGTFEPIPSDCQSCHNDKYLNAPNHVANGWTDCQQCHTINGWDQANFNHSFFPLNGGHTGLDCTQCHVPGNYESLTPDCNSCHQPDYQAAPSHVASGFPTDCLQCHTVNNWDQVNFSHTAAFPLTAGHSGLSCSQCHTSGSLGSVPSDCNSCHNDKYQTAPNHVSSGFSVECQRCHSTAGWENAIVDHSFFPLTAGHSGLDCTQCHTSGNVGTIPSDCYSCHQSNYQSAPNHAASHFSLDCLQCHTMSSWTGATIDHSFFPLTAGHNGLDCVQCHTSGTVGTIPSDCYSCHQGNYQSAPSHVASNFSHDCLQCHKMTGWDGAIIDHSFFPLTAGHSGLDCVQCHTSGNVGTIPSDCYSCHQSNYQSAPNHLSAGFSHDCLQCHTTSGWPGATIDHSFFPLTAGHSGLDCVQCHKSGTVGTIPSDCYSCHQSNYQSAPNHVSSGFSHDCLGCHTTTTWLGATFNHQFPLTGNHNVSCTTCHLGGSTSTFTCLNSCHSKSNTDSHHSGVSNYTYDSAACYRCHPNGRE